MEFPYSLFAKGLMGILLIAGISLLPLHDEWKYEIRGDCSKPEAETCGEKYLGCKSLAASSFDPVSGLPQPALGAYAQSEECFKHDYARCKVICGFPTGTGSWWGRFQRMGPWYLKFIPGAHSHWKRWFSDVEDDSVTF